MCFLFFSVTSVELPSEKKYLAHGRPLGTPFLGVPIGAQRPAAARRPQYRFFFLESCLLIFDKQTKSILSYKIMNKAAPAANGLPQGVAPTTNRLLQQMGRHKVLLLRPISLPMLQHRGSRKRQKRRLEERRI
jgi:hypothetical protein